MLQDVGQSKAQKSASCACVRVLGSFFRGAHLRNKLLHLKSMDLIPIWLLKPFREGALGFGFNRVQTVVFTLTVRSQQALYAPLLHQL
jgi:hypothetical protein